MRIAALSVIRNVRGSRDCESNKTQSLTFACPCDTFVKSQPTFGAITREDLFDRALRLRKILNLPCAYTGIPMLPPKIYNNTFLDNFSRHSLEQSIRNLSKFKKNMNKPEKAVFNRILNTPAAIEAENLHEVMVILRKEYLNRLQRIQLRILNNIDKMAEKLSPDDQLLVKGPTQMAKDLILQDDPNKVFKRKTIIKKLNIVMQQAKNTTLLEKIVNEANKLPSSTDNQYAFIAKYSKSNRSSKEIEQRLLSTSISSFDHKMPQDLDGQDVAENVVIVSSIINSRKSNDEPVKWFQDNRKNVRKNAQKQVNFLIELSNKHYLKDYDWYILCLKNGLVDSSKGFIDLDVSKIRIDSHNAKMIREIQEKFPETFGNRSNEEIEQFISSHSILLKR